MTPLADGRFSLELGRDQPPETLLGELAADGVRVISLNPIRATLEEYFVQAVGAARQRDTGGI